MASTQAFRTDIQALRGLAILLVLIYLLRECGATQALAAHLVPVPGGAVLPAAARRIGVHAQATLDGRGLAGIGGQPYSLLDAGSA